MSANYFKTLNSINVNDKTESKNGLTYLSWAWAWGELKKLFPGSFYTIYENKDGLFYHTDGKTAWVKTGVTVVFDLVRTGAESAPVHHEIEHIEYLPVMDFKNRSIPLEQVTSFDVNKAIQRSLTKAVARHGLGLYIYAGEDLPEDEKGKEPELICADCGSDIMMLTKKDGSIWKTADIVKYSTARYGRPLCGECMKKAEKTVKTVEQVNEEHNG